MTVLATVLPSVTGTPSRRVVRVAHCNLDPESLDAYRREYEQEGYLALTIFTPAEVERLRSMVTAAIDPSRRPHRRVQRLVAGDQVANCSYNARGVYKITNTPLLGDDWFRLISNERILSIVTGLLGPDVNFHMGWAHLRPPDGL